MGEPRRRVPPDRAMHCRRAAALFTHWRRKDGELAVFDELDGDEDWFLLVLALLEVGSNMAKAARDGRDEEYLARVVREASLDEVSGADPGGGQRG